MSEAARRRAERMNERLRGAGTREVKRTKLKLPVLSAPPPPSEVSYPPAPPVAISPPPVGTRISPSSNLLSPPPASVNGRRRSGRLSRGPSNTPEIDRASEGSATKRRRITAEAVTIQDAVITQEVQIVPAEDGDAASEVLSKQMEEVIITDEVVTTTLDIPAVAAALPTRSTRKKRSPGASELAAATPTVIPTTVKKKRAPAVAAVTPQTRGRRTRQPSPDKFLTPGSVTVGDWSDLEVEIEAEAQDVTDIPDETIILDETVLQDESIVQDELLIQDETIIPEETIIRDEIVVQDESVLEDAAQASKVFEDEAVEDTIVEEAEQPVQPQALRRGGRSRKHKSPPVIAPEQAAPLDEQQGRAAEPEPEEDIPTKERAGNPPAEATQARKPKGPRKKRPAPADGQEPDEVYDITVHRLTNTTFKPRYTSGVTSIDTLYTYFNDTITADIEKSRTKKSRAVTKEEKLRRDLEGKALQKFGSVLDTRLTKLADELDTNSSLSLTLRRARHQKTALRNELLALRREREDIERSMDDIRKTHHIDSSNATNKQSLDTTFQSLTTAVERGRTRPVETGYVGLETLMKMIAADMCGQKTGVLEQVKEFNRFLEAANQAISS